MIGKLLKIFFLICCCILLNGRRAFPLEKSQELSPSAEQRLSTEKLAGEGIWIDPAINRQGNAKQIRVKVWFEDQFLGDGKAYRRRAGEFASFKRRELRQRVMQTLKTLSRSSYAKAEITLEKLHKQQTIENLQRHWIINGFTCTIAPGDVDLLKSIPGVKKIFLARGNQRLRPGDWPDAEFFQPVDRAKPKTKPYLHPWYVRSLLADKVRQEFSVTGKGTLNIVHDFQFQFSANLTHNLYRNAKETPGNGKDDDGNGLIDDYHGFNFDRNTAQLKMQSIPINAFNPIRMHGFECAAIICGTGTAESEYEFGIAPEGQWAGVIAAHNLESAIEWAVEQSADTYSMSFSIPNLGEYRSHWRKILEQGSFCGIYFVSGAGNFAQRVPVPVQMRIPEDIPDVVFAAAGVQRDFSRTPFSSKGPVLWNTEHYRDGEIQKPEVCAFNHNLPALNLNGTAQKRALNGNSFAGPMFCGSIALMLSADPDLLPWDLKEIITSTASDVAKPGVDYETGHGLINCYRAVKEVLRRKAIREGTDPAPYTGRVAGDELDVRTLEKKYAKIRLRVESVIINTQANKIGLQVDDRIISYNGTPIYGSIELLQAMQRARQSGLKAIPLEIERADKTMALTVKPGPIGITTTKFDDQTFE